MQSNALFKYRWIKRTTEANRMWIFCGGMFRSGSTVQYQIASHLVEQAGRGARVTWHAPEAFGDVQRTQVADGRFLVFKAHGLTAPMRDEVVEHGGLVLTVHRDIRDVVVSAMRKNGWSFREIWRRDRLRYWTRRFEEWAELSGALVSRYDALTTDLAGEVRRIASRIGLTVEDSAVATIAATYAPDRQRERTENVRRARETTGTHVKYDPLSLLHHNHIASGRSGEYRSVLGAAEIRAIEDECGAWIAKWGYSPDHPSLTVGQRLRRFTYRRAA